MSEHDYLNRWRGVRGFVAVCIVLCCILVLIATGSFIWAGAAGLALVAIRLTPVCAQLDAIEAKQEIEAKKINKVDRAVR